MKLQIQREATILLGISLIMLVVLGLLAYQNYNRHEILTQQETQSLLLRERVSALLSGVMEAESGVRGYIITRNQDYLIPFMAAVERSPELLSELKSLKPDDVRYHQLLGQLQPLVEQRLERLEVLMTIRNHQGLATAISRIRTDTGFEIMSTIGQLAQRIKNRERQALERQKDRSARASIQTVFLFYLGVFLILLLQCFVFLKINSEIGKRRQVEENLEHLVDERTQDLQRYKRRLEIYTAQLEEANRDLESFAVVASHDMQAPLRKVRSFSELLKRKEADQLSPEGRENLERLEHTAGRMQDLIRDLLDLSRISAADPAFEPVNMEEILQSILAENNGTIQDKNAKVTVGEMLTIEADRTQMYQLLSNLVNNALKYHEPGVAPVVQVSMQEIDSGRCLLIVADQGIGFEQEKAERIFQPFERLHGKNKYAGTGIGLDICKRIVERHGGKIEAQAEPGQGATFIVTLPVHH